MSFITQTQVRQRGFTILELLVVIVIIGLLSVLILASVNSSRAKARDAQRITDMRAIQDALALYAADNEGTTPSSQSNVSIVGSGATDVLTQTLSPNYMTIVPNDPLFTDPSGTYTYRYRNDGTAAPGQPGLPDYTLSFCQETSNQTRFVEGCTNVIES